MSRAFPVVPRTNGDLSDAVFVQPPFESWISEPGSNHTDALTILATEKGEFATASESVSNLSFDDWQVKGGVAYNRNSSTRSLPVVVSTDPEVVSAIANLQPEQKPARKHERPDEHRINGLTVMLLGGASLLGVSGVGSGLASYNYMFGVSGRMDWAVAAGLVGGVLGAVAVPSATSASLCVADKIHSVNTRKKSMVLSPLLQRSEQTYVIPNAGKLTSELGSDVAVILDTADTSHELLDSKVLPLVRSLMQAEVMLTEIDSRLKKIDERKAAIGVLIDEDRINSGELETAKETLIQRSNKERGEVSEIKKGELNNHIFKDICIANAAAPDVVAPFAPYLREFYLGALKSIGAAYSHSLRRPDLAIAEKVINDLMMSMKVVDSERSLPPIYEAFRKKCALKGFELPMYEVLQEEIFNNRELR